MKKLSFVLTYNPDPRLRKRINTFLRNGYAVEAIFAEREYLIDPQVKHTALTVHNLGFRFSIRDRLGRRLHLIAKFFIKAGMIIKKTRPDIIYFSGFDILIASYLLGWHKRSFIIYEVSDLPGGRWRRRRFSRKLIDNWERKLIRYVHKIILVSPYFYPEKYQRCGSGVFILENLPEKRLFNNFRKGKHKDFVVGCFGLIHQRKSMETLLEALGGCQGIKVLIAGESVGQVYKDIIKLALRYNNIECRGHYYYEKDILSLYSAIDCVYSVYDSDNENTNLALGNKLYEAIVCQLPIITTKNSKMGDYVETKGIGFSVNDRDPEELRKIILALARDNSLVKNIEQKCSVLREECFYESKEKDFIEEIEAMLKDEDRRPQI